jgi:hypothetical protein
MTTTAQPARTNRLIRATSPYLRQHAHNPVDWFEWSPEAFDKARKENKPVFLSVGYSACHWCHVMEHESFSDDGVAAVLNEHFVSIKVDREERPDVDEIYMAYTQERTGSGGWPMSVWMTPDGVPFHAGTYFPKDGFIGLCRGIARTWTEQHEKITQQSEQVRAGFQRWAQGTPPSKDLIPLKTVHNAARTIVRHFDTSRGGISGGGSNKFPPSMTMELMLRTHRRTGDGPLLEAVRITLDNMARGGIYDHVGGGICRYSTDPEWLVPHFEKMLYDQAMVSSIYLDAGQVFREPLYAATARDILDYVLRDLRSPEGGFYSSRDADSDGKEGAYYIWTVDEIGRLLGEEDAGLFRAYYDVTEQGNWIERFGHAPAGPKNILHVSKPPELFVRLHDLTVEDLTTRLARWRETLLAARAQRTPPTLDDKVLTSWNGLMIASLAKGASVLDEPRFAEAAAKAADFILTHMRRDGRLLRSYRDGQARITAYLDDYAFLVEGLINLYEATFDERWLREAGSLTDAMIRWYADESGGFYFTASDGEELLARTKSPRDGAIPSGNSVAAMNLLRLAILLDRKDYRERAEGIFRAFAPVTEQSPFSCERLLCAVDFYHGKVPEIAIVGAPADAGTVALLRAVHERYRPNKVVAGGVPPFGDGAMPLLRGKTIVNGKPAAYVCENFTCKKPVTLPEELQALLP